LACYSAAGIDYASREEIAQRAEGHEELRPVDGLTRSGGSSWQSLTRQSRGIETAYLNGEIVLLGRLHRIRTPVNRALTDLALRAAREGVQPGSFTRVEIEEAISSQSG
jgi:2-dehydropantoate 2-reductase